MNARVLFIHTIAEARRALAETGLTDSPIDALARQAIHRVIKVQQLDGFAGDALIAELHRAGGIAARSNGTALLMATRGQFETACAALRHQRLPGVATILEDALAGYEGSPGVLRAGRHTLDVSRRAYVLGILNATPDSFYDRGRYFGIDRGVARAAEMLDDGAELIEIGGESAVPGKPLSIEEEIDRIAPLIERVAALADVPIVVETYKPAVARAAIAAGANMVNDISGLADPALATVCAETGAALVVMHMRDRPKGGYEKRRYAAIMDEITDFLRQQTSRARELGVERDRIVIDPGLGFTNTALADLEIMHRFAEFRSLGYPILLATSRKDYLEEVLNLPPVELLEGTAAAVAYGVSQGARLVRVHDPGAMSRVARVVQAISLYDYWNGRLDD